MLRKLKARIVFPGDQIVEYCGPRQQHSSAAGVEGEPKWDHRNKLQSCIRGFQR